MTTEDVLELMPPMMEKPTEYDPLAYEFVDGYNHYREVLKEILCRKQS